MTTFQTVIYSMIEGISTFLPISSQAHHILIPYIVDWQEPNGALLAAMSLGALISLLVYFRHDWASMVSCFLQVILFRKRPMTLDERLPLFLFITCLPTALASYYFQTRLGSIQWTPLLVSAVFVAMSLPLWGLDSLNRKIKGMFDWNWFDAAAVGITQASALIPGWDPMSALLLGAYFLNYKREPAAKYAYFATAPFLISQTLTHFKDVSMNSPVPAVDFSWLSFGVAIVVTLFVGLLSIGGFMKHIQQKGIGQYMVYRWILAMGVGVVYWIRR